MNAVAIQETGREMIVKVDGLHKSYPIPDGKLDVLHDLSFQVRRGEFLAVSGPSGSGKTTLLALLGALDRPDSGEIWLDDIPVHTLRGQAAARFRRQKVGFIFQLFYLLPNLTARENVMAPLMPFRRQLGFNLQERAVELLERVGLGPRLDHIPAKLSGGEQQRVAIARALINRPAVLLADEPTGNLDPATGAEILDVLRLQQEVEHQTLIMVTHDPSVAARADRRVRLRAAAGGLELEGIDELNTAPRRIFVPEPAELTSAKSKRRISRRVALVGLGAALLAAGGITWYAVHQAQPAQQPGNTLYTYHGHSSNVNAVAWSPDSSYIVSCSAPFTMSQWRSSTSQQRSAALAGIQSGSVDASIHVWMPETGRLFASYRGHKGGAVAVIVSSDSKSAASGGLYDGTAQVWLPRSGKHVLTHVDSFAAESEKKSNMSAMPTNGAIWAISWSPDGTHIASGDDHGYVQVWDPLTGSVILTYKKHTGPINAIAWSVDGAHIASASADQTVQVWDATNGKQIQVYTEHAQDVRALLWAADGQSIFSAGADHIIWVWDATSGNPNWLYTGHTAPINALQWTPDNSKLLSTSDDKTVRLWEDWQSGAGKLIYTYQGHTAPVLSASWSGDGTKIASGSSDKSVRVWLAATEQSS